MTTTDVVFLAAVLCGCFSAWKGNRTAYALLSSVALTSGLIWAGAPFNLAVWLLIDLAVVVFIAAGRVTIADLFVIAIFVPAWTLYIVDWRYAGDAINLLVAAQFILTLPFAALLASFRARAKARRPETDGMLFHV